MVVLRELVAGQVIGVAVPVRLARSGESVVAGVGDGAVGVHPHAGVVVGFGQVVLPAQGVQVRRTRVSNVRPLDDVVDLEILGVPAAFGSRTFWIGSEDVIAEFLGGFVFGPTQIEEVSADRFDHPSSPGISLGSE